MKTVMVAMINHVLPTVMMTHGQMLMVMMTMTMNWGT